MFELGNDKLWVKDCTSFFPSPQDKCFNSKNQPMQSNSTQNVLNGKGSIGAVETFKMRFSKFLMDVKFGTVKNDNSTEFDGTIGLNPSEKSVGLIRQILEKCPEVFPMVEFFLRNRYWYPTRSITVWGYFKDITKDMPFFFHSSNPFHFPIKQVIVRNSTNSVIKTIPASSVELSLRDFSIQA